VPVPEARMEQSEDGLVAATPGWFTVNVRDAAWVHGGHFADACVFEGGNYTFPHVGYTLSVLQPGQASALYHREAAQEDFLVLAGECLALVEGQERRMQAWDFLHCPPWTEHIFVGAGDAPCLIFMAGARGEGLQDHLYVRDEVAVRHGAAPAVETAQSKEAYAPFARWRPGPPESFAGLPWELR
jgi:uncharacterized cupin superfamily protein